MNAMERYGVVGSTPVSFAMSRRHVASCRNRLDLLKELTDFYVACLQYVA